MLFVKIESLNFKFYKLLEFVNCHFSVYYFHLATIHIYIFNTLQIFFLSHFYLFYIILDIKHIYKDRYQTV